MSSARDLARLVRAGNLLLAGGGVAAGGWIALGAVAWPTALIWAALSALGLGAAGNAVNDLFDLPADRVNRPRRPLVTGAVPLTAARVVAGAGAVLGLLAARAAGREVFILGTGALVLMTMYSPILKRRGLAGNVAVAIVGGLPLLYGAVAVGAAPAGVLPFALGAWIHFIREVAKDVDDIAGDLVLGRRTLAVRWGAAHARRAAALLALLFLPASLLPWLLWGYAPIYLAIAALADAAVLWAAWRLLSHRDGAPGGLKVAMLAGIVALVAGRI